MLGITFPTISLGINLVNISYCSFYFFLFFLVKSFYFILIRTLKASYLFIYYDSFIVVAISFCTRFNPKKHNASSQNYKKGSSSLFIRIDPLYLLFLLYLYGSISFLLSYLLKGCLVFLCTYLKSYQLHPNPY